MYKWYGEEEEEDKQAAFTTLWINLEHRLSFPFWMGLGSPPGILARQAFVVLEKLSKRGSFGSLCPLHNNCTHLRLDSTSQRWFYTQEAFFKESKHSFPYLPYALHALS
jgi:hypothetical protein